MFGNESECLDQDLEYNTETSLQDTLLMLKLWDFISGSAPRRLPHEDSFSFEERVSAFCADQMSKFDQLQRADASRITEYVGRSAMWSLFPVPREMLRGNKNHRGVNLQRSAALDQSISQLLKHQNVTTQTQGRCINSPSDSLLRWEARLGSIQIDCLTGDEGCDCDKSVTDFAFCSHVLPMVFGVYDESCKGVYFGSICDGDNSCSSRLAICSDLDEKNKGIFFPDFMLQLTCGENETFDTLMISPYVGKYAAPGAENHVLLYLAPGATHPVMVATTGVCIDRNGSCWMARIDDQCPCLCVHYTFRSDDHSWNFDEQMRMFRGEWLGDRQFTLALGNPAAVAVKEAKRAQEEEEGICLVLQRQCSKAEIKRCYGEGVKSYRKQFGSFGPTYMFNDRDTPVMQLEYTLLSPHDVRSRADFPIDKVEWRDSMDVFYDAIFRFHYHLDKNSRRFIHEVTGDGNCFPLALAGFRAITLPRDIRHQYYHFLRNLYCDSLLDHIDDGPKPYTLGLTMLEYFQRLCLPASQNRDIVGDRPPVIGDKTTKQHEVATRKYLCKVKKNLVEIRRKFVISVNESRRLGSFNTPIHFVAVALYTKNIVHVVNFDRGFSENMKIVSKIVPENNNGVNLYMFHDPQKAHEHYVTTVEMEDVGKYRAPDEPAENAETHDERGYPRPSLADHRSSDVWNTAFHGKRMTRAGHQNNVSAQYTDEPTFFGSKRKDCSSHFISSEDEVEDEVEEVQEKAESLGDQLTRKKVKVMSLGGGCVAVRSA
jgi:hypothetical protein